MELSEDYYKSVLSALQESEYESFIDFAINVLKPKAKINFDGYFYSESKRINFIESFKEFFFKRNEENRVGGT